MVAGANEVLADTEGCAPGIDVATGLGPTITDWFSLTMLLSVLEGPVPTLLLVRSSQIVEVQGVGGGSDQIFGETSWSALCRASLL